ncbi:hypothetical protein ES703_62491 [subsurface metagenome]
MDGEAVKEQEVKAPVVEPKPEPKPEPAPPVKSSYDDFVEGVATREIALAQGAKPERVARVFQGADKDGEPVVHIAGEDKVVSDIGDILERGGYRVQEWHIKRPDDVAREAEKVRPALAELIKNMPPTIGTPEDIIKEAKGLPLVEAPASSEVEAPASSEVEVAEAAKELGEALAGFSPGKETREEIERKGES